LKVAPFRRISEVQKRKVVRSILAGVLLTGAPFYLVLFILPS
jgi:hypothetical protein